MGSFGTRTLAAALVVFSFAGAGTSALAVTGGIAPGETPDGTAAVTTPAASRARAEVQIRRIKNLLVTRKSHDEAAYERLEHLQRVLRGER